MARIRVPSCSASLREKSLTPEIRKDVGLDDSILLANFGSWTVDNFIDAHFLLETVHDSTGHNLYQQICGALGSLNECERLPTNIHQYLVKFYAYFNTKNVKLEFLLKYREMERLKRMKNLQHALDEEVDIASNELVESNLAEKSRKRSCGESGGSDQVHESLLKLKVNKKNYSMQSPNIIIPPNTPLIDSDNLIALEKRTDVCFSSDQSHASQEALDEYNKINLAHDTNASLKSISGAIELLDNITKLDAQDYCDNIAYVEYEATPFNRFLKFAMIDYAINCERITPTPSNDERTIFCEVVVPMFKYFGNLTKLLSFRWGEKKDKESSVVIFYVNNAVSETKLIDGIGEACYNSNCIVIESSGFDSTQNIHHTREDSMKNIVSATDILLNIMCRNSKASLTTMKKINIYSIHVIQKRMCLVRYSLKSRCSWKAIECGSAEMPLTFVERKKMIKNQLEAQKKIMDELENENLGIKEVARHDIIGLQNMVT